MEITKVEQSDHWDAGLIKQEASFLQSSEWGEILIAEGKQVERLAVIDEGQVVAQAQIVYQRLPFGWRYAFAAKGSVFAMNQELRIMNQEYELLMNYLQNKKCTFLRFEPLFVDGVRDTGYVLREVRDSNPRTTTILDLNKSEDELLASMHKKTRYSIRTASEKQLVVSDTKDYKILWNLLHKTARRDGFRLHAQEHYRLIVESSLSFQLTAYHSGTPIATAVFIGFGNTFTYLFAASDYERHDLLAPYLIQWEAIKLAKKLGYKQYDFFGIAPSTSSSLSLTRRGGEYDYDRKHAYAGITKFKIGFGGEVVESPGTFDVIIKPLQYRLYSLLRRARRLV